MRTGGSAPNSSFANLHSEDQSILATRLVSFEVTLGKDRINHERPALLEQVSSR
jgi:hypothetical protein